MVLLTGKKMKPEKIDDKNCIKQVELLTEGTVKIPYTINSEEFEIIIYKEDTGYNFEVMEKKEKWWKILKNKKEKNEFSPTTPSTNEKDFSIMIGKILDYYIGIPRLKILKKAKDAYDLLHQEDIKQQQHKTATNMYTCLKVENIGIDIDLVSDDSIQKYISKETPIQEWYLPKDLVNLESKYFSQENRHKLQLRKEANEKLNDLAKKFTETFEGDQMEIYSAYRDKERQEELWNENTETTTVASPNTSEHQLGLAIDIKIKKKSGRKIILDQENIYKDRLKKHAHIYGFHNSYQKGQKIDGIWKEWRHRRYLGKELATILADNKISFTEYYKINTNLKTNEDKNE